MLLLLLLSRLSEFILIQGRFLGDRTLSYNQFLTFILILRAPASVNRMYTHADVAIEGGSGIKVGVVIYGGIPPTIPSEDPLVFRFR